MKFNSNIIVSRHPQACDAEGGAAGRLLLLAAVHAGRRHVEDVQRRPAEGRRRHLQRGDLDLLHQLAGSRVDFKNLEQTLQSRYGGPG